MIYAAAGAAQVMEYAVVGNDAAPAYLCTSWGDANKLAYQRSSGDDRLRIFSRKITLPLDEAQWQLEQRIAELTQALPTFEPHIYVSGYGNYREVLATRVRYKWNRVETAKPEHFGALRKHAIDRLGATMVHWCEPDDVLATVAREMRERGQEYVLASVDKDVRQVPGDHLTPGLTSEGMTHVTPTEGMQWFYMQVAMGDSTDGVGGARGIGPAKAEKRMAGLTSEDELWQAALACYAGHADPRRDAIETARMVWLCDRFPMAEALAAAQAPHHPRAAFLCPPSVPLWVPPDER
jgi:hypothetical protein